MTCDGDTEPEPGPTELAFAPEQAPAKSVDDAARQKSGSIIGPGK